MPAIECSDETCAPMRAFDKPLLMQHRCALWQCGVLILMAMASALSAREASAQQNLFNVPVPAVAAEDKIFFQEQLNIGSIGSSNTTLDYGLGNKFEIGLNVFNVGLYPAVTPPRPGDAGRNGFLVNMQKVFEPSESFEIGIGTQQGVSATTSSQQTEYMGFGWSVIEYDTHNNHGRYLAGAYIGNPTYTGSGNGVGWMLGVEYPVIPEKSTLWQTGLAERTKSALQSSVPWLSFHDTGNYRPVRSFPAPVATTLMEWCLS